MTYADAEGACPVSVVMIFLNPGAYLEDAIASVLGQTMGDLELLLVDDGSRDGSDEVIRQWAERDRRVVTLAHDGHVNRGMGASRALGVSRARGTWVALLDGDDVWEPHHLERQLAAARRHPQAGIVVSPSLIWRTWRGGGADEVRPLPYPSDTVLPPGALLESTTFSGVPIPTCGLMFRRDLTPWDGPAAPSFRGLFEDQTMVSRLTVTAPAVVVGVATSRYRQHLGSAVHRSPGRGGRDPATLRYLTWIESFLAENGQLDDERHARIARVRATFDPRWRFWAWYLTRWAALRVLPEPVLAWIRRGRPVASGVMPESDAERTVRPPWQAPE